MAGIDDLAGEWMLVSKNYDYDEDEGLVEAEPLVGGRPVTFAKAEDGSILISGFTADAELDITATVDLEEGTFSIADGQTLLESDYGPILLCNAAEEGAPLVGSFEEDGSIDLSDQIWCTVIGGDGEYAGSMWDYFYYSSSFARINGIMTWNDTDDDGNPITEEAPLLIFQETEMPQFVYVFNFANMETMVVIDMKENNKFEIATQLVEKAGDTYGDFYTYGLTDDGEDFLPLTGTGTETALTFDCSWTLYSAKGYWYGQLSPATIAYTDGSKFVFPVIPDVAATPADPSILQIGAYNASKGFGYVIADVPTADIEGNPLKESKLSYILYADIEGEITPVVFIPELYKNLTEEMTEIPYTFNDGYDFNVYSGSKVIFLNFDFTSWKRIGIQSIYYGGDERHATEIVWMENVMPAIDGDFTFDFNSMDVATSTQSTTDGDITEELTLTSGSVELIVSPKTESGTTENRFWSTSDGPQLRVYSGTLTFSCPDEAVITKIVVNAGRWNSGNSADSGEFTKFSNGETTWTGSAQTVVVTIAGNSQINSFVVTVEKTGGESEDELIVLPEGVEPQAWALEGTYTDSESSEDVAEAIQVAFDGNTIYVQGLAYYFEEAWLKGTIAEGVVTFPTGQFVGEDEYGKEYMLGYNGEEICDIDFAYDPEAKTLTQLTDYIVENGESKDELNPYGSWTNVVLHEGEPVIIDPVTPPADLVTTSYLFKSMMQERTYEDDDEEEAEVKALAEAVPAAYENQVLVGFDGDDLYIQGLSEDFPLGWVKATKNADGKYVIPANQYMDTYQILWFKYAYYFTALDEELNLIDAVLTVDPETKTISSDQTLALNGSKYNLDYYVLFTDVTMDEMQEIATTPVDPAIVDFVCTEDTKYPKVQLDIPAQGVNGEALIKAKLAYQLFIVKDGVEQPLVLTTDLYEEFTEDMSIIPYYFEDNYDIYRGGSTIYLNQDREEMQTWTKIGVKSIYYGGGETNESNIVWFDLAAYWADPTGVAGIAAFDHQPLTFDLTGRVTDNRQKGLLIMQVQQQDGSVKTVKVLRK